MFRVMCELLSCQPLPISNKDSENQQTHIYSVQEIISYEIPVETIVKEMSRSGEATPSTGISFPVSGLKQPAKVFVEVVQPA